MAVVSNDVNAAEKQVKENTMFDNQQGKPTGALTGLRVLDFTRYVSGPYTTMLLADAGAEVIKVEPVGGELTRFQEPMMDLADGEQMSTYFLRFNRNKKSVELDPRAPEHRGDLEALIQSADVLVENFRPGALEKLGLGWDRLQELNPQLIYASISGFGHSESPNRDLAAFNLIAEAMAGTVSQNPGQGEAPRALGLPFGDSISSLFTVMGIQQALLERHRTGRGKQVDVAMYDVMLSMNEMTVALKSMVNHDFNPARAVHDWFAPYGFFEAKDGWLALCVGTDGHWQNMCAAIGWEDFALNPDMKRGVDRAAIFKQEIFPRLHSWLMNNTVAEVIETLGQVAVPVAPLHSPAQLLQDPQATARNMLVDYSVDGRSFVLTGNPLGINTASEHFFPKVGQHTEEVLQELRQEAVSAGMKGGTSYAP